jgi:hypothetical protein
MRCGGPGSRSGPGSTLQITLQTRQRSRAVVVARYRLPGPDSGQTQARSGLDLSWSTGCRHFTKRQPEDWRHYTLEKIRRE